MEISLASEDVAAGVAVRVSVRLSSRELNRLFLSGDTLVQLPLDGAVLEADAAPIPRTSIFLSELAGSAEGFSRVFADAAAAAAFEAAVRRQLETALEAP
ncbi:MAG TPA: hypothetical protein VLA35_11715 [Thermoleophilia bacterium]|nr:hypothetical protein [Thermoleophilia bacterium]